jgi:hypothetical protein
MVTDIQSATEPILIALKRLVAQDSWEQPYADAAREALNALIAALQQAEAQRRRRPSDEREPAVAAEARLAEAIRFIETVADDRDPDSWADNGPFVARNARETLASLAAANGDA